MYCHHLPMPTAMIRHYDIVSLSLSQSHESRGLELVGGTSSVVSHRQLIDRLPIYIRRPNEFMSYVMAFKKRKKKKKKKKSLIVIV
jgi:hypothetical protein